MDTSEPTPCPVELCEETVDYTDLIPHMYTDHDGQELCETIANLVADLAQEQRACAERGRYLAEVDAALIAAGQDEAGGYIAYPRRIQQLAGEARFWHFEYREAMDNYKDEAAALRDTRAELATARAAVEAAIDVINAGPQMVNDHVQQHWSVVARRAAEALRSPAGQ